MGWIHEGQYGSRPKQNAHISDMIDKMQFEISRTSRSPFLQMNFDAASCYDRIRPSVSSIASRKLGVPNSVVKMNMSMLENAEYKLKTAIGISKEGYKHSTEYPIYGTGQGSGTSPFVWCFISSILVQGYDGKAHGATYTTPDRSEQCSLAIVGYVDDSNSQVNDFDDSLPKSPEFLNNKMQEDAQLWSNLLWVSGGKLELSKNNYHHKRWELSMGGAPTLVGGKIVQDILVQDRAQQTASTISSLSVYTTHTTLGCYVEPSGNQIRQYRELMTKCDREAEFIRNSSFNRKEAWTQLSPFHMSLH